MTLSSNEKLELFIRSYFPLGLTVLAVLISFAPSHIAGIFFVNPPVPLILIYCWCINYCDDFSYGSVFAIGIFTDFFDNTLFGMHTLTYIIFYFFSLKIRRYLAWKSFRLGWIGFGMLAFMTMLVEWGISSINAQTFLFFTPLLVSWFITVMLYPVIFWGSSVLYTKAAGGAI